MLAYGNFLTVVINFLIIAWILFLLVKAMNLAKKKVSLLRHHRRGRKRCLPRSGIC